MKNRKRIQAFGERQPLQEFSIRQSLWKLPIVHLERCPKQIGFDLHRKEPRKVPSNTQRPTMQP